MAMFAEWDSVLHGILCISLSLGGLLLHNFWFSLRKEVCHEAVWKCIERKLLAIWVKKKNYVGSLIFSSTIQKVFVRGVMFHKALFLLHLETWWDLFLILCLVRHEGNENIPWNILLLGTFLAGGQLWEFPCQVVHLPKTRIRRLIRA